MSKNFKLSLPAINLNGLEVQLGLGGLHSVDKPGIFIADDEYELLDADVVSYYPTTVIKYGIAPAHLDRDIFRETLVDTLENRKSYKKRKKENIIFAALEYGLKIALNSVK